MSIRRNGAAELSHHSSAVHRLRVSPGIPSTSTGRWLAGLSCSEYVWGAQCQFAGVVIELSEAVFGVQMSSIIFKNDDRSPRQAASRR
jgi:hypothetical protein